MSALHRDALAPRRLPRFDRHVALGHAEHPGQKAHQFGVRRALHRASREPDLEDIAVQARDCGVGRARLHAQLQNQTACGLPMPAQARPATSAFA